MIIATAKAIRPNSSAAAKPMNRRPCWLSAAAESQQGRLFIGFAAAELLGLIAFAVAMIILYAR